MPGTQNQVANQDLRITGSPTFAQLNVDSLRLDGLSMTTTTTNSDMAFVPNGTGQFLIGSATSAIPTDATRITGIIAKNSLRGRFYIGTYTNAATDSLIGFFKSRSTTVGSNVAVQSGDALGAMTWIGDDGSGFQRSGAIIVTVSGSVSTGIVPGQMTFTTTNTSGASTTALTISNAQVSTFAAQVIAPSFSPNTTSGIIGTTTNNNAATGSYGEYGESIIATGSAVSLTTATSANVTSVSLPSGGDYQIWGNVGATATVSMTVFNAWISLTSATQPDGSLTSALTGLTSTSIGMNVPSLRVSVAGATTVYLSTNCTFTGTCGAYGKLQWRRLR